jgi:hypothetical protein
LYIAVNTEEVTIVNEKVKTSLPINTSVIEAILPINNVRIKTPVRIRKVKKRNCSRISE